MEGEVLFQSDDGKLRFYFLYNSFIQFIFIIIRVIMSVNLRQQTDPTTLKSDIKDFITLLQKSQLITQARRRQSVDSDKLSVIYSASQPQSSSVDKQNSHNSANVTKSRLADDIGQFDLIMGQIRKYGLTNQQLKLMDKLEVIAGQWRKNISTWENKFKIIQEQFQEEKKGTDQILKALLKMDEAQKQLWNNYSELSNKYLKLQQKYFLISQQNQNLEKQLAQNNKDIEFMRKLVLVANQNYQNIEKKCKNLEKSTKMFDQIKQQRSSPEITSRSTILQKKCSYSPTISDRSNMSACKGSFQQNYRKLVLRTLKSKAIR